ncbi:MAG: serine/threonine-protein phosphatase [Flaviaesturariibacter sp.]|nr:serine/threonine-protein phosphatase [Flaviaesturariibacter sp.]
MAEQFFGLTDTGRQRQNNEDAFIAETVLDGAYVAACVIDGVGGYEGGEVAAAIARDALLEKFRTPSGSITTLMQSALVLANERILKEKQESGSNEKMACVLTLALVQRNENKFYYAHIGDTRLYLFRDGSLVKITKDHSFVGFLEDSGRLTEEAAMSHPKRNEINKALGFEPIANPSEVIETGDSPFLSGDTILLCSDGLTDMIPRSLITSLLGTGESLESTAAALVRAANEAGGKDNITAVLVRNDRKPILQKATKPAVQKKKEAAMPATTQPGPRPAEHKAVRPRAAWTGIAALLALLFLAGFIWQWRRAAKLSEASVAHMPAHQDRSAWQRLQDTLRQDVSFLSLPEAGFADTIPIGHDLIFRGDSLHLRGNGRTVLLGDSTAGSLLRLAANVRFLLLDSLSLEDMTLQAGGQDLDVIRFRNVRFRRAGIQMQAGRPLSDTVFTGTFYHLFSPLDTSNNK